MRLPGIVSEQSLAQDTSSALPPSAGGFQGLTGTWDGQALLS